MRWVSPNFALLERVAEVENAVVGQLFGLLFALGLLLLGGGGLFFFRHRRRLESALHLLGLVGDDFGGVVDESGLAELEVDLGILGHVERERRGALLLAAGPGGHD